MERMSFLLLLALAAPALADPPPEVEARKEAREEWGEAQKDEREWLKEQREAEREWAKEEREASREALKEAREAERERRKDQRELEKELREERREAHEEWLERERERQHELREARIERARDGWFDGGQWREYDDDRDYRDARWRALDRYPPPQEYLPPPGYEAVVFEPGMQLPAPYVREVYFLDHSAYGLPAPPPQHRWVQLDDDAVLISLHKGVVADFVYDLFELTG